MEPGDFVGCYLPNHEAYIDTLLACFKIRAVPVNVNYRYRDEELHYLLDNSDSVAVIFEGGFSDSVAARGGGTTP